MPFSMPAARANGLKVEPAWPIACVALLIWLVMKSAPPYIATTSPVPGRTAASPIRRPSVPLWATPP